MHKPRTTPIVFSCRACACGVWLLVDHASGRHGMKSMFKTDQHRLTVHVKYTGRTFFQFNFHRWFAVPTALRPKSHFVLNRFVFCARFHNAAATAVAPPPVGHHWQPASIAKRTKTCACCTPKKPVAKKHCCNTLNNSNSNSNSNNTTSMKALVRLCS